MCTLTWTTLRAGPKGKPEDEPGYQLWFNRDEQLTRAPELPPRVQTAENGVRYMAPEDSEAGGTWIMVNEHGVTVALLNGYAQSRGPAPPSPTSRGHLVRGLAGISDPYQAFEPLSPRNLRSFRPAVVLVKAPHSKAVVVRWDGLHASIDMDGERQLPLTSSGYTQEEVQRERARLYQELVLAPAPKAESLEAESLETESLEPEAARLAAFQNYVDPEAGPTPFTPSMRHPQAATRSQCIIEVTRANASLTYRPGPPHESPVQGKSVLELSLQRAES